MHLPIHWINPKWMLPPKSWTVDSRLFRNRLASWPTASQHVTMTFFYSNIWNKPNPLHCKNFLWKLLGIFFLFKSFTFRLCRDHVPNLPGRSLRCSGCGRHSCSHSGRALLHRPRRPKQGQRPPLHGHPQDGKVLLRICYQHRLWTINKLNFTLMCNIKAKCQNQKF